jgi:hypothetical protein
MGKINDMDDGALVLARPYRNRATATPVKCIPVPLRRKVRLDKDREETG